MWETRARYEGGTEIEQSFPANEHKSEAEQQYELECWLLEQHPGCVWHSVNWVKLEEI